LIYFSFDPHYVTPRPLLIIEQDIQDAGTSKDALKQNLSDRISDITGAETRISLDNFVKVCDIVVEQVEMRRRALQKFLLLDADKSGFLEKSELFKGA
jgi:Ca2+-binding EF-hand superfamily protein